MGKKNKKLTRRPRVSKFILNCVKSTGTEQDWTFGDAVGAQVLQKQKKLPVSVDLREDWWTVRNQGNSGACVGFATADGLLRWHYVKEKLIGKDEFTSPRFIWMANKETDDLVTYPTSFLDSAGTSTKLALKVARKYGCVPESMLPMRGRLSTMNPHSFFTISSQYRINAFYNLFQGDQKKLEAIRHWLANHGPVLTRLDVDQTFKYAKANNPVLEVYDPSKLHGGHAVCFVGYDDAKKHLIVRNSWGTKWADNGFAYATYDYAEAAFDEAYGAMLNRLKLITPHPN